jgi:hypothetical protein
VTAPQGGPGELREYVRRFTNLRTDRNRTHYPNQPEHRAPHKPLLLLAVMDLFAEGELERNLVTVTPDLLETFALYWSRVMPRERRGILAYPFFHLRSEGFWHLVPRPVVRSGRRSGRRKGGRASTHSWTFVPRRTLRSSARGRTIRQSNPGLAAALLRGGKEGGKGSNRWRPTGFSTTGSSVPPEMP